VSDDPSVRNVTVANLPFASNPTPTLVLVFCWFMSLIIPKKVENLGTRRGQTSDSREIGEFIGFVKDVGGSLIDGNLRYLISEQRVELGDTVEDGNDFRHKSTNVRTRSGPGQDAM